MTLASCCASLHRVRVLALDLHEAVGAPQQGAV